MRWGIPLWSIIVAAFVCIGAASFGIFSAAVPVIVISVLATVGLGVTGAIPASIFAASPRMVREAATLALLFGLINQTSNLGQLLGPAVLGALVQHLGWTSAPWLIAAVAACGVAIGLMLRSAMRPVPAAQNGAG
jgi:MFS family permease